MRVELPRNVLAPAVSVATRALPSKSVRPILSGVLLHADAENGILTLTASDLELTVSVTVPALVRAPGSLVIPGKALNALLGRFGEGQVSIEAVKDRTNASVSWAKMRSTLNGYEATDYPKTGGEVKDQRALNPALLAKVLATTIPFAAKGETARALLTGVELRISDDGAVPGTATDGFTCGLACDPIEAPSYVILSAHLSEVQKLLKDGVSVRFGTRGNHAVFTVNNVEISARMLEGKYFAVRELLPKEYPTTLSVNRKALLSALQRVSLLVDKEPPHAVLARVDSEGIHLSAHGLEGEGEEIVDAEVAGSAMTLGFNAKLWESGLKALEADEVHAEFSSPTTLAMWSEGDRRWAFAMMPLQLPE